jgi:hypothetical protein
MGSFATSNNRATSNKVGQWTLLSLQGSLFEEIARLRQTKEKQGYRIY